MKVEIKTTIVIDDEAWKRAHEDESLLKTIEDKALATWLDDPGWKPYVKAEHTFVRRIRDTFLYQVRYYWGHGESKEEALRELRAAGGTLRKPYIAVTFGEDSIFGGVHGSSGAYYYAGADPTHETVK